MTGPPRSQVNTPTRCRSCSRSACTCAQLQLGGWQACSVSLYSSSFLYIRCKHACRLTTTLLCRRQGGLRPLAECTPMDVHTAGWWCSLLLNNTKSRSSGSTQYSAGVSMICSPSSPALCITAPCMATPYPFYSTSSREQLSVAQWHHCCKSMPTDYC